MSSAPKFSEYLELSRLLGDTPDARRQAYATIYEGSPAIVALSAQQAAPVIVSDHDRIVEFLTDAGQTREQASARADAAVASPVLDSSAQLIARAREWANRPERAGGGDA